MAWVRVPGSARRYRETETGETISRRQYDERYGRLRRQGFLTNEQQAEANRHVWPRDPKHPGRWRRLEFTSQEAMMAFIYRLPSVPTFVSAHGIPNAQYEVPEDEKGKAIWRSVMEAADANRITAGMVYGAATRVFDYPTIDKWVVTWRFK